MPSPYVVASGDDSKDDHLLRNIPPADTSSPLSSTSSPRAGADEHWTSQPDRQPASTTLSSPYPAGPLDFDLPHLSKTAMSLPDPSYFPDPYPIRPLHPHLNTVPALSSAGSSSTRSSAYASSSGAQASGEYGHIQVASDEDDPPVGIGITSDTVVQLLASDGKLPPSIRANQSRAPIDQTRWSESYSSIRSRSSSIGANTPAAAIETLSPKLQEKPSYDIGWQSVDERDEMGLSEDETDDEHLLSDADEDEEREEERTSAVVIAEEGRGLIVHGSNVPVVHLHIQPGLLRSLLCGT